MTFSYISTTSINGLATLPALIVLIIVILIGVVFDIVGVAITCATEEEFHAMASKKVKGAKTAIKLIRSAPKVSNICNDVIGDICGIVSGSMGAMIAIYLTSKTSLNSTISSLLISSIISSITVGFKAIGKSIAVKNSDEIIFLVAKVLNKF